MSLLALGVALAFNLIIIIWKFKHSQVFGAVIDASLLTLVAVVFSGSFDALTVGTIGSAIVSLYLLVDPPKFTQSSGTSAILDSVKRVLNIR